MSLDLTKRFEIGNSVYFECYYRNQQGELGDPTSPLYQIQDIKGQIKKSGTPTKKSTGIYYVFWEPDRTGDFTLIFSGSVGTFPTVLRKKFKVIRTSWAGEWFSSSSSSSSFSSSSSCSSSFSSSSSSSSFSSSSSCNSSFSSSSSSFSSSSSSFSSCSSSSSSYSSSSSSSA